jgi:cation-transporting ATPase 13A3/4/5
MIWPADMLVGSIKSFGTRLRWTSVDDDSYHLDEHSLRPLALPPSFAQDGEEMAGHDYTLAVTGDVFRWMINNSPIESLERVSSHRFEAVNISDGFEDASQDLCFR